MLVRGEIGTTGYFEEVELDPSNPLSVRYAVAYAVELEHSCSDNSCDIAMALEEGYVMAAAHLLVGATETPFLDAVLEAANVSQIDWPEEWDEWVVRFRELTTKCANCDAYVRYESDGDTYCDNCGREVK